MAVRVFEVDALSAAAVVGLHVFRGKGSTAIGYVLIYYATENSVELGVADVERIVVALELVTVIEI